MPKSLSAEAKREWRRVVGELDPLGLLAKLDRALLIRYVTMWSRWTEINELLGSEYLVAGARGNQVKNPLAELLRQVDERVTALARELGLSPVARIRAGVQPQREEEPDELEQLRYKRHVTRGAD